MPYQRTLQKFCLPEFFAQAPEGWDRRLREVSPILPNLSHLVFRKFEPRDDWFFPERPIWAIYRATPRHLVEKTLAEMFAKHWSEHFDEGERVATKAIVSDYQHFMWHTQGVRVTPFWLLQGEWGGTPTKFTKREKAYLRGAGAVDEPFPIGWFPACAFDERAVCKILERDRLIQSGNRFDELEKQERPDWKKAEDDAAEFHYRETVLESLRVLNEPATAFMQSQVGKEQMSAAVTHGHIRPAPDGLVDTLATWKDVFKDSGRLPSVGAASARRAQVAVL